MLKLNCQIKRHPLCKDRSMVKIQPSLCCVTCLSGVKVKSCKTQTSMAPPSTVSPERPHCQPVFRGSGDAADNTALRAGLPLVPVAIPLGQFTSVNEIIFTVKK